MASPRRLISPTHFSHSCGRRLISLALTASPHVQRAIVSPQSDSGGQTRATERRSGTAGDLSHSFPGSHRRLEFRVSCRCTTPFCIP